MKAFFIYNPQAGQIQIKNQLWGILNVFCAAGYELTVRATQAPLDAYETVRKKAHRYPLVICSGGDGTLNEVINGLLELPKEERPTLGYIPAGSTNDYAVSLKLPRNMIKAAELVTTGTPCSYDMGRFNQKNFVYVAAFGAFTQVSYATSQEIKNLLGHLAYIFEGIKSVTSIKSYDVTVTVDEITKTEKYIYGMVTNSLSVGGLYNMSNKGVQLDDGLFEVMLIRTPQNALQLSSITSYLLGIEASSPLVETFKTNHITISCKEEMPWALDGEYGGDPDVADITVLPQAITILSNK